MSFLTILLVASAFYFAQAKPQWNIVQAPEESSDSVAEEAYTGHSETNPPHEASDSEAAEEVEAIVPAMDPSVYRTHLDSFMEDMTKAVDQYLMPLMSKLDVTKRNEMKNMGLNGIVSYVNYLLLLAQEKPNAPAGADTNGDSPQRDEIILEFDTVYPLDPNLPFIPESPLEPAE